MKKLFIAILAVLLLTSCAQRVVIEPSFIEGKEPAGFWQGVWHGFTLTPAFVASWFDSTITLYDAYNDGFGYNFGFYLMVATALAVSTKKRRWS